MTNKKRLSWVCDNCRNKLKMEIVKLITISYYLDKCEHCKKMTLITGVR